MEAVRFEALEIIVVRARECVRACVRAHTYSCMQDVPVGFQLL